MSTARASALTVLGLHVAYGVALAAAPAPLTERWLGPSVRTAPTQVALRALAWREVLLHGGALAGGLRGAPLRPWLCASIAGDLGDVAWTALGRRGLPHRSTALTAAAAGASAALTGVVLAKLDDD